MSEFRLDRALSVGVIHPCLRATRRKVEHALPILMYHGICADSSNGRHPYFETNTPPAVFASHMQFLHENGYTTVDLNEAVAAVLTGQNMHKRVAITFDDGYRNAYTHALPILAGYGMRATVFIVSEWTKDRRYASEKEYLTWAEVREMHNNGIRIGSHTVNHGELYSLTPSELEYEIRQSKETIEDGLGEQIRSFSYPYAFPEQDRNFAGRLKDLLETHGYENGVSTILGTANRQSDWFFLPRLPVNGYDDLEFFGAKLEGSYDWLHAFQLASKYLKGRGAR